MILSPPHAATLPATDRQHTDESKSAEHKAIKRFLGQQRRERRDERGEGDAGGGGGKGGGAAQISKRTAPGDVKPASEGTPRSRKNNGIAGKSAAHPIPSGNPTPPTVTVGLLNGQPNCREEIQRVRGTTLTPAIDRRRRRPQSAGATMTTSGSSAKRAGDDGGRKLVSLVTPSEPGEVHGITKNRETRRKVVPACWRASVSPGRRPLLLGKTNVRSNTTKKVIPQAFVNAWGRTM